MSFVVFPEFSENLTLKEIDEMFKREKQRMKQIGENLHEPELKNITIKELPKISRYTSNLNKKNGKILDLSIWSDSPQSFFDENEGDEEIEAGKGLTIWFNTKDKNKKYKKKIPPSIIKKDKLILNAPKHLMKLKQVKSTLKLNVNVDSVVVESTDNQMQNENAQNVTTQINTQQNTVTKIKDNIIYDVFANNYKTAIDHKTDNDWCITNFELKCIMGSGNFGKVYNAYMKSKKCTYAIKIMRKSLFKTLTSRKQVLREIEIHSRLKHPNIIRFIRVFNDSKYIYMVLEIATKGELYIHLHNAPNKRFSEMRGAKYIYQLADAIDYCNSKNIMHRDLKPENVLLTANDDVKLTDFGWATTTLSDRHRNICGTLDYLPPEIINGEHYDKTIDYWAIGVFAFEILTGKPPFEAEDRKATEANIQKLRIKYPVYLSWGAVNLITNLLKEDPQLRIIPCNVMKHTWIKNNIIKRCLKLEEVCNKRQINSRKLLELLTERELLLELRRLEKAERYLLQCQTHKVKLNER